MAGDAAVKDWRKVVIYWWPVWFPAAVIAGLLVF